jgi:hypothetical protein
MNLEKKLSSQQVEKESEGPIEDNQTKNNFSEDG